jgi:hypothetical protein
VCVISFLLFQLRFASASASASACGLLVSYFYCAMLLFLFVLSCRYSSFFPLLLVVAWPSFVGYVSFLLLIFISSFLCLLAGCFCTLISSRCNQHLQEMAKASIKH